MWCNGLSAVPEIIIEDASPRKGSPLPPTRRRTEAVGDPAFGLSVLGPLAYRELCHEEPYELTAG